MREMGVTPEQAPASGSATATEQLSEGIDSSTSAASQFWQRLKKMNMLILPIIVFMILMTLLSDRFFTTVNQLSMMRAASIFVIVGVGQAFVMCSRNIDLSVGSMLGLIMGLVGTFVFGGGSIPLAILLALGLGVVLGLVNGFIVTWLKVPALLATLGTLVAYRGLVNQYMYGSTVSRFPDPIVWMGQGRVLGVPVPIYFAAATAVLGAVLYRYTRFGRYAIAIGGNEEAAVLAGIRVRFWKNMFFAFQGACVGLAALIFLGRLDAAHPGVGTAMELHIIAGVVLGGTILFGGYATMWGVVLGMFLIELIGNGLLLSGAGFFWQQVFLGGMLILAVALQMLKYRKQSFLI